MNKVPPKKGDIQKEYLIHIKKDHMQNLNSQS